MNPWIAKALVLAGTVVMIAIRAPHGHRSRIVKAATSHKTPLETGLLVLAGVGFFVPLIWVESPAISFGKYANPQSGFANPRSERNAITNRSFGESRVDFFFQLLGTRSGLP